MAQGNMCPLSIRRTIVGLAPWGLAHEPPGAPKVGTGHLARTRDRIDGVELGGVAVAGHMSWSTARRAVAVAKEKRLRMEISQMWALARARLSQSVGMSRPTRVEST